MGTDIKKELQELVDRIKGFNNNPEIIDQRAKDIMIIKLEEASMWFDKLSK